MPTFDSPETVYDLFARFFEILLADDDFSYKYRESNISLHLICTRPDLEMCVSPETGVVAGPPAQLSAIRIKMSCDTAHALWLGKIPISIAIAAGKVRVRGSIAEVLEFVPILHPAFDLYSQLAAERGIIV